MTRPLWLKIRRQSKSKPQPTISDITMNASLHHSFNKLSILMLAKSGPVVYTISQLKKASASSKLKKAVKPAPNRKGP